MGLESKLYYGGTQNKIIKPLWVKYGKVGREGGRQKSVSGKKNSKN